VHLKYPLWTPSTSSDVLAWQFPELYSRQTAVDVSGLELAAGDVFTGLSRHSHYHEMSKCFSLL